MVTPQDYPIESRPWSLSTYAVHCNNSMMATFGAPSSTPAGDRNMCPLTFCAKFNAQQLLFEAIFDIVRWQHRALK